MGMWIAILIGLFVLGSVMALKPSSIDMRLDKVRMTARKLDLNPKVIACPDWIRGNKDAFGRGMIGQYAIILEDLKLPETYYKVIDNELRAYIEPVNNTENNSIQRQYKQPSSLQSGIYSSTPEQRLKSQVNFLLDGETLELPEVMAPLLKGVYTKANSLVIFWDDDDYVKPMYNPSYNPNHIEQDLLALKDRMNVWANTLVNRT